MRKSYRTITETRHQEDKQNKATSSLFPIMIIAKVESNVQQNIEQTQNPTMGATINNQQQQQHHRPRMDSSLCHRGTSMYFTDTKSSP